MKIIDGRTIAQKTRIKLKNKIKNLKRKPGLGVILIGDNNASRLYVSLKEKACAEVGINFYKFVFPAKTKKEQIFKLIDKLNKDKKIDGILVQIPLPKCFDTSKIIERMSPQKDIDGFHPQNTKALLSGKILIEPVLAKTIWTLIKNTDPTAAKKRAKTIIIGNSDAFTVPLEAYLNQKGLLVNHLHFKNIAKKRNELKKYDIAITAAGSAQFFKSKDFKKDAMIIDVGINRLKNNKIVGDVDLESFKKKNNWITPVPGGVGPVTVATLLENTYLLAQK